MKSIRCFFTLLVGLFAAGFALGQTHTPKYVSMASNTKGYYEYLPEGYDANGTATYPLILYMTGIGEFGSGNAADLPKVLKHGITKIIEAGTFPKSFTVKGQTHRFIVITPQFRGSDRPNADDMNDVLNYIIANYKVNVNRIYISGYSYGGGLCFAYTGANATYAKRIAAIVPVANPDPLGNKDSIIYARSRVIAANNVPVWAAHNERDPTESSAVTKTYIANINEAPAPTPPARMTIYDAGGHDACVKTYNPARILDSANGLNAYEWMLQYQRGAAPNAPPVAAAGADQTITLPASSITLSGSATDEDGTISGYAWTKTSGPTASITNAAAAETTVTGLAEGTYTFRLTVTDNDGATATDDVTVIVNAAPNLAPTAAAGADQTITLPTSTVTVDGNGTDSDGSITAYAWTKVSGPAAFTITSPASDKTTITGLVQGAYVFRLTVTDNSGAAGTDDLIITVNAATNIAPKAAAGADQTITLPTNSVSLTGSGTDSDGTITSYNWTKISGPGGTITTPAAENTTITGLVQGSYVFRLTVTDNDGATGTDDVTVTVNAAANKAPVAAAGADQTITLPASSINLKGSATDEDGTISSYAWTKTAGPDASITTASAAETTVTGLVAGTYTFRLTVTDDDGATDADDVTITVNAVANKAPTAAAGTDQTIALPANSVTLSGSATDEDGTISSYAWTKTSGPTASITNAAAASTTVTGLAEGTYTFRLTVTDNDGATGSDEVTVIVNAAPNLAPKAVAGADQNIMLPATEATLTGNGTDEDGTIGSYAWTKVSGPDGGTIATPAAAVTMVTALQQGTYVFRLTVTDDKGATASDDVTVEVTVVTSTGEEPDAPVFKVTASPNPTANHFSLKITSPGAKPVYLRLTDAIGRIVEDRRNVQRDVPLSIGHNYKPGVYYAEAVQNGKRTTIRLLKQ